MSHALTAEQIQSFKEQGAISGIRVLTENEAQAYRDELLRVEAALGQRMNRMDGAHIFFRWAWDLATHPAVLDVLESLLGPDLFVHSTRIFYKHPNDGTYVSWHQDGLYSNLNAKPAPSAWIALSDSRPDNGCLRVIPRSHRRSKLPHTETYAKGNLLNHGEVVAVGVDESQAVDLSLEPGEMSLHDVNTIHGSNPNRSNRPRIGFSASYVTPEARTAAFPVIQARGSSTSHQFELASPPPIRPIEESIQAHEEFMRRLGMRSVRFMMSAG